MYNANKSLQRVIGALLVVIVGLGAVVMHLASGGKPAAAVAPPQTAPALQASLKPPAAPLSAPVLSAPAALAGGAAPPPVKRTAGLMTGDDVAGKPATELHRRGNEIYARHGYRFHKPDILAYFSEKSWYHPDTDDMKIAEARFSSTDEANLALLHRHEKKIEAQDKGAVKPSRLSASPSTSLLARPVSSTPYIPTPAEMNAIPARPTASVPAYNPPPAQSSPPIDTSPPALSASDSVRVWVNTRSGVYHMPGSRWYGGTENGRYMSEPDAVAAGYRRSERG